MVQVLSLKSVIKCYVMRVQISLKQSFIWLIITFHINMLIFLPYSKIAYSVFSYFESYKIFSN